MRKFLGTLALLAIIIGTVGFFRGWFSVGTEDRPDETNVEIRIDKEKIKEDAQKAADKVEELRHREQSPESGSTSGE